MGVPLATKAVFSVLPTVMLPGSRKTGIWNIMGAACEGSSGVWAPKKRYAAVGVSTSPLMTNELSATATESSVLRSPFSMV